MHLEYNAEFSKVRLSQNDMGKRRRGSYERSYDLMIISPKRVYGVVRFVSVLHA